MADKDMAAIGQILADYGAQVVETVDHVLRYCADDAVIKLEKASPERSGTYKHGWTKKKVNGRWVVWNKPAYRLTHLLEHGHDVVVNGRKVGFAPAKPHIKGVEEEIKDEIIRKLEENL